MATLKKVGLVLLAGFAVLSTLQALNNAILSPAGGNDFQWGPARAVLHGVDPYAAHVRGDAAWQHMAQYPNYPVSGLIFLLPFGALEWPVARTAWAICNLAMTGWIIWLLSVPLARIGASGPNTTIPWRRSLVMLALLLSSMAWRNSMAKGQHGLFSLCFTLVAVVALHRNIAVAGLASALAWLKPTIGIPLSLYLARSRRGIQALAISAAAHSALTVAAALWLGSSILSLLLGPVISGRGTTPPGRLDTYRVASDLGIEGAALPLIAAIAIAGLSVWSIRRERDALSALSTLCFATLVVAFHSGYDFVIGIVPLAYAFRERFRHARAWYLAAPFLLIWLFDRPVAELIQRGWIAPAGFGAYAYHGFSVVVFYAALVADLGHRWRLQRSSSEADTLAAAPSAP